MSIFLPPIVKKILSENGCRLERFNGKPADSIDLKEGVILHLDNDGLPLEIEILDAAKLSMIDEISVFPAFGRKKEELRAAI